MEKQKQARYMRAPAAFFTCREYTQLSGSALKVLMAVYVQFKGNNNGRLYPGMERLRAMGVKLAPATLAKACKELRATNLVVQTRQGRLPDITEWWALTCWPFNWSREMDIEKSAFQQDAYIKLADARIDPQPERHLARKKINVPTSITEVDE